MSGIHRDAVGAWKREKPSWVGLPQSKHRLVFYFFSQAGIWPSSYLHSVHPCGLGWRVERGSEAHKRRGEGALQQGAGQVVGTLSSLREASVAAAEKSRGSP